MQPNVGQLPQIAVGDASTVLWFFFVLGLVATGYFVFAELYHWIRYGYMYPLVWVALPVYVVGILVLLGGMLAGIAAA